MKSMGWHLMRAALVKVGDGASPRISHLQHGSADVVRTRSVSIKGNTAGAVFVASVPIELKPDSDIAEIIGGQARRDAEAALGFLARFSAIEARATHELSSPQPFIGLASDNMDDLAQLEGHRVALEPITMRIRQEAEASMNILETVDMSELADRNSGIVLLAEALNCQSPLGRYSQLVRLFERAFGLGPGDLTEPLARFLTGGNHHFDAEEVRKWMNARSLAIHADRRDEAYLDSDVRPFESRMLEAGYDVLLNKAEWHTKSSERRKTWMPPSGSRGAGNERMYIQQGQLVKLKSDVFDGFMAYPLILDRASFADVLPRAAWLTANSDGSQLKVLGDWEAARSIDDAQEITQDE